MSKYKTVGSGKKWTVIQADVMDYLEGSLWLRQQEGDLFHAALFDPPYHLTSIVNRFGKENSAPAKFGRDGAFARQSRGFMGQTWDGGDLVFRPELWSLLGQHLYPGAFGMAFASSRGWHRMAAAIEDAGLIIHPSIFGWVYLCLSEDTEILTNEGWRSYRELLPGSMCLCYNVDNKSLAYMPIEDVYIYDHDDTAYSIQSDSTDQIVTRNHRVIVERDGAFVLREACTLEQQEIVPILEAMPDLPETFCSDGFRPVKPDAIHWTPPTTLATITPIHYKGKVWCVRTPTGTFVARRNGRIFITGNSGFPKATRIDTQVDKAAGVDVGKGKAHPAFAPRKAGYRTEEFATNGHGDGVRHLAQSPLAQTWQGHRYGLQALKPALEPIIVFQRPYEGKPVRDIVTTGAGALNIDGGRIGTADNLNGGAYSQSIDGMSQNEIYGKYYKKPGGYNAPSGRWPANFILECPCDAEAQIDCPVRLFDEQAGESTERGFDNSGPASRMFHRSDWSYEIAERLAQADPVRYEPKASSAEREAGLDSLATQTRRRVNSGGLENEPRFAPTEIKNPHPTVKPISLAKYLATLLLPPQEYQPRRILVPFAGVGSEMIGAILAGWDEVIGIEREGQYLPVTQARLKWWSQWPGFGQTDTSVILAAQEVSTQQAFMFAED